MRSTDDLSSHPAMSSIISNAVSLKTQSQGKARALNTLLPYVRTDFVLELDAEDWLIQMPSVTSSIW